MAKEYRWVAAYGQDIFVLPILTSLLRFLFLPWRELLSEIVSPDENIFKKVSRSWPKQVFYFFPEASLI